MVGIRKLEEQFEQETVDRIRALQSSLNSLPSIGGAVPHYVKELHYTLEAGLLLASLHLSLSFLELFVRETLISSMAQSTGFGNDNDLEKSLEDGTNPQWNFYKMIDELRKLGILNGRDAEEIKEYYKQIRIPVHHGLTRRFIRNLDLYTGEDSGIFMEDLFLSRSTRPHDLEEHLEDNGIMLIEQIIAFITKYAYIIAKL